MSWRRAIGFGVVALVVTVVPTIARDVAAPAVEHHLHIRTAAVARLSDPISGEESSPATREPRTAEDALAALDAAGIERALVLSLAYRFAAPEAGLADEAEMVRRENDYVAQQVATAPDRLIGACSVNPLTDYALAEVERCAADPRLSALKLHLANSGVDLGNDAHVATLEGLFRRLAELGLPAVVHLRTREESFGAEEATAFIDRVLAAAPGLPVQIAHMAGWGGYDEATDAALGAFAEALSEGRLDPDSVSFDLGAVVFQPEAAGDDQELAQQVRDANRRLAERIREIGIERVVYATDWPGWPPVPDMERGIELNVRLVATALPLEPDEIRRLFSNVGCVIERSSGGPLSGPDPSPR